MTEKTFTFTCVYGCEFTGSVAAHFFEEHPLSPYAELYATNQMSRDPGISTGACEHG
jgi:hypothetical protein